MPFSSDPAAVVQRQLDAYNAHDVSALLEAYAPAAALFEHPNKLLARGAEALRERYTARFREPGLHAALLGRTVCGNVVIDHEIIRRPVADGVSALDTVAMYQVVDGRIAAAWFINGPTHIERP